jgi:hypothetical protein
MRADERNGRGAGLPEELGETRPEATTLPAAAAIAEAGRTRM